MIAILFSIFLFASATADTLEPCDTPGQLKPDPKHCDHFFQCTEAGWQSLKCRPKTLFNPKLLVCDWAKNVKCAKKSLKSLKDDLEPCDNIGQLKPDTASCNNFYQCTNNGWALLYCQPPTLFNPKILNCDWPANVECAKPHLLQALEPCDHIGQLKPDTDNCANFYQCTNGGWAPLSCKPPTLFNPKILNCDWPNNVECAKKVQLLRFEGEDLLEPCDTIGEMKRDPDHCDLFYQCTNIGWALLQCKPPSVFNPKIKNCDWPKNVDC